MGISSRTSDRRLSRLNYQNERLMMRSRHSKNLRGIGFEVEEMMKLFLVIIIGLGIVILIIAASGGISSLLAEFCAKNPSICGGAPTPPDTNTARASFDALVMAHNCVLDPSSCNCIKPNIAPSCTIQPQKSQSLFSFIGNGISGFQVKPDSSKEVRVECEPGTYIQTETKIEIISSCDECKCTKTNCKKAECSTTGIDPNTGLIFTECKLTFEKKGLDCNVVNFNIPDSNQQSVPDAVKEYMFGYNDPNFLIYFQDFPEGGDEAWSSFEAWYEKTGEMMLWGLCLADAVRPIGKFVGKKLIIEPLTSGVTTVKNTFNKIKDPLSKIGAKFKNVDEFKIAGWDFGAESRLSTYTKAKQWFKTNIIQKTATFVNKPLPNVIIIGGTYTGVDAVSAYYDNLADSKIGKFVITRPQSLVFQVPLKLGEPTKLNDNIKIVDQETGITAVIPVIMGNKKHLALASPCNADLVVSKTEIKCESYVYSPDGSMECDIKTASGDEPTCDFSSLGDANPISSGAYNSVKKLIESKKTRTFEYEGNLLKKVYLPLFETNNYFGDFRQKSGSIYGINYYENGNLGGELEMMCAPVQSLIASNAPLTISPDLIGKLKNVYYSSSGAELCWFAPVTRFSTPEQQKLKKKVEDLLKIGQDSFDVIFVKENNRFIAEITYPITIGMKQYPIILQDNLNEDGNWDSIILDMTTWLGTTDIRPESGYFFTFDDTDIDGKIDSIYSLNCRMPAIQVTVDGTNYNSKYDNNFCYSKFSPVWGVGLTTASFAIDAFAKRNPMTYVGAIAVDCGLAYLEHEKGTSWPSGGIK